MRAFLWSRFPSLERSRACARLSNVYAHLLLQAAPVLFNLTTDKVPLVKDTAAWTIGRICEQVPEALPHVLPQLVAVMQHGLTETPKIAANMCWVCLCLSCLFCSLWWFCAHLLVVECVSCRSTPPFLFASCLLKATEKQPGSSAMI